MSDDRDDNQTFIDHNTSASQPNESRYNLTVLDAPGATYPSEEERRRATTEVVNNEANEQPNLGENEQKVVESSELQVKDPREPKLRFGPLEMFDVIGIEWLPIPIAATAAGLTGVAPLLFFEVLGGLFNSFTSPTTNITSSTNQAALYIFIIALVAAGLQFISHFIFNESSQRIGNRIKFAYFKSVTMQEIGFFDIKKSGAIANSLADDAARVTDAFSVNFQDLCQFGTQFIVAVILALTSNYAMALFQMIAIPIMLLTLGISGRFMDLLGRKQARLLGDSISTANEVISSMRVVRSMAGEEREIERYSRDLDKIRRIYWIIGTIKGFAFAIVAFSVWGAVSLAFWFGGLLIGWNALNVGGFIKVYGLVLIAILGLTQVFILLPEVIKAISASALLLTVIKREPAIRFKGGKRLEKIDGLIEFKDVSFKYPARPKITVLKNFNLRIEPGQSIAIVGQSGSGKSTIVGLLEKWYEPESGTITIDGVDIKELDPQWLHRHIGIVQQEPTLFAATIKRNISYAVDTINMMIKKEAKMKKMTEEEVNKLLIPITDEIIQNAAKAANCHDFIMTLPEQYNTVIGERGVSMSGGQKQRIAIARAVLQDPKILLLDEATSALDTKSEALVQNALNKLMVGRTSIVIAHRLTTIQDCDNIVVMKEGKVIEMGKHDELIARHGAYFKLARKQMQLSHSGSSSDLSRSDSESELGSHSSDDDSDSNQSGAEDHIQTQSTTISSAKNDTIPTTEPIVEDIPTSASTEHPVETEENKETDIKRRKKRTKRLRRRHRERKKRRKEMEDFTNEEDIEDPHEPKIRSGIGIIPYIGREWLLVFIGAIGAGVMGAVPISFYLIFGRVVNALIPARSSNGSLIPFPPGYSIPATVARYASYLAIVAAGACAGQFANMFFFSIAGERIAMRVKRAYFKAVVNQEMGFFDIKKSGKLLSVLSEDIDSVQNGFAGRLSVFVQYACQFILGVIFALIESWNTALLALAGVLFLVVFVGILSGLTSYTNKKIGHLNASALATATEVIGSIRTVRSMGGEEREQNRFNNDLKYIFRVAIGKAFLRGISQMTIQFIILSDAAFVFWYGGRQVATGALSAGQLIQVFGFVLFSVLGLSLALTELNNIVKAFNAAKEVLKTLKRKPQIPIKGGRTLDKVEGNIEFEAISFSYPSRPNVKVLKNFSLSIKAGQHIALVGESGSGKSTISGLIERFYDPDEGRILLDGLDLKEADPQWLHRNVAIVTQEPTLFATTIKKNISYSLGDVEVPMERIIECAKVANCHDFITQLPNGYDTMIGERGVSMSGGQKQRIAIARAMLQDSQILILDEATSALDTEAEAIVQEALNRLMVGRTSIVIAHRLSTIQNCDLIVTMKNGEIVEKGTHDELIQKKGMYYKLARKQMEFGMSAEKRQHEQEIQITEND